eukprot:Hpha_TRINITY_DN10071_c0_g1::TRINITY_DN10071_c0_g1_i1::g.84083::m.84083
MSALFVSLPSIRDVLLIAGVVSFVASLLALQFWSGAYHQRCYSSSGLLVPGQTRSCGPAAPCEVSEECKVGTQYRRNVLNFDNAGFSLFLVISATTLGRWGDDALLLQGAAGDVVWLYFVIATAFGFILMNLILAVLISALAENLGRKETVGVVVSPNRVPRPTFGAYKACLVDSKIWLKARQR